jgi:hypothetical protein
VKSDVDSLLKVFPTSRRQFLKASAIAGGLTAVSSMTPAAIAGFSLGRAAAQEGDLGVLNFALTLEHFEARLYQELSASGVAETDQQQNYFEYYGNQEAQHVDFLTAAIKDAGGDPVEAQDTYKFPAFSDIQTTLETVAQIEDVGASAYLGAAPLIKEDAYLEAAVRIHSTEAYHATGIRFLAYGADGAFPDFNPPAFAEPRTPDEVSKIVMDFGVMPGMGNTGAGGMARRSTGAGNLIGVAGLGAAAAAGLGLARGRKASDPK